MFDIAGEGAACAFAGARRFGRGSEAAAQGEARADVAQIMDKSADPGPVIGQFLGRPQAALDAFDLLVGHPHIRGKCVRM